MPALEEIFEKPFVDGDKVGDFLTIVCSACNHLKEDHAKQGQGRSRLPCEHPGCDCGDFHTPPA